MWTTLLMLCLASGYATAHKQSKIGECYVAGVNNYGVQAQVFLCPRDLLTNQVHTFVDLHNPRRKFLPQYCDLSEIQYQIHESWKGRGDYGFGYDCSSKYTGGHYDPTYACSRFSGSVPQCRARRMADPGLKYSCNPWEYKNETYNCEVGDLSGKFGRIQKYDQGTWLHHNDVLGLPSSDFEGKSIVFRCKKNQRAFCAKLKKVKDMILFPEVVF